MININWTRVGIIGFAGLCVWAAWPKGQAAAPPRPLLIKAALKDAKDPVIVLGDSIVEYATLPRSVCGHPIVNAGIAGSTTASGLDSMLIKALGGKRAAMIVVSLGINDAATGLSVETYKANYLALLTALRPTTSHLFVTGITPIEVPAAQSPQVTLIEAYNLGLPGIAQQAGASLVAIPSLPTKHTTDGIHLNADAYAIWSKALFEGIEARLCKAP